MWYTDLENMPLLLQNSKPAYALREHIQTPTACNIVHLIFIDYSSLGIRKYASIAALNAAKPAHPKAAACGPAFAASTPPVIQPAATPFLISFFARS
jgi:hypothetical protein